MYHISSFIYFASFIQVQTFSDYSETNEAVLDMIEAQVFDEVRFNTKLLKILYPSKNYSLSSNILQHRPAISIPGVRTISTTDSAAEAERRTRFSFAIIDVLQIPAPMKLLLLQVEIS